MRVLVTGAAGFLGRWFAKDHIAAGDSVVGIDNLSSPNSIWPDGLTSAIVADLGDGLTDLGDFDRIYHFAAPVGGREKIEGDPLYNADSLRLDSLMFRWAIHHTALLLYPSSSAVYGVQLQGRGATSLTEGAFNAQNPSWLAPDEMYGFTKLAGERLAFAAAKYGLNTLCIRPFSGFGEGQSMEYPIPSIAARALRRDDPLVVWGPGNQRRDFIHVSDVVGATMARLAAPLIGYETMNIGSGVPISFNDIALACASIVGYRPRIANDVSKPVGVQSRWADNVRMTRYYDPKVNLREGLTRVIESLQ